MFTQTSCKSLTAVLLLAVVSGCGTDNENVPRASASGVVYTDGVELKSGVVRFVPIDGTQGPVVTASVADGFFALPPENGPPVGMHRIEVEATDFLGFDPGDQAAAEAAMQASGGQLPKSPVPPHYGKRSPLREEVLPEGAEGLVFLLTSDAKAAYSETSAGMNGYASR